jgi:hypothetical protein
MRGRSGRAPARAGTLLLVLLSLASAACRARAVDRQVVALADDLRRMYAPPHEPGERWRRRATVRLPDGREVPREQAYRDHEHFQAACRLLLESGQGDDAMLGAWLLGTLPAARGSEAAPVLAEALVGRDERAAFEAALALERIGGAEPLAALEGAARSGASPEIRTAAQVALERAGRTPDPGPEPGAAPVALPPAFRRGVSWWFSEAGSDAGASSFRRLATLGVTWVSIHTWDPLQRGLHDPVLAEPRHPFAIQGLPAIVKSAHAAGLAVMLKPHLEIGGHEPTPEELRVLRGPDEAARRRQIERMRTAGAWADVGRHNQIEMKTEADWRRWFRGYEGFVLPYAEAARAAGADAFCVGRELDTTVIRREADWRRLIAKVRAVFPGPLAYSANFDTWREVGFWDALDSIGVSAYFPLSERKEPSLAELEAGWARALGPLEEASRRYRLPVMLTEAGFPSIRDAARAPWSEGGPPADVWLQARCYEATLRAVSARPWITGTFFWLWERSADPPFRDSSHAIPGKPAAYVMARWYRPR